MISLDVFLKRLANFFIKLSLLLWFFVASGTIRLIQGGGAYDETAWSEVMAPVGLMKYFIPLLMIVSLFFGLLAVAVHRIRPVLYREELPFIGLVFLGGLSALWSEFPYNSFRGFLIIFSMFFVIWVMFRVFTIEQLIDFLFFVMAFITSACLLAIFIFPDYGVSVGVHEGRWQGIFGHKNGLGSFCAFLAMYMGFYYLRYKSILALFYLFLSVVMALMSGSWVGFILVIFVCIYFIVCVWRFSTQIVFLARCVVNLFLFSILVVFLLVALGVVEINFFGKEGFNNRDKIWSFYLFEALASPLMGYGTEQLAVKTMSSYAEYQHRMGLSFVLGSAHNGFIEIFYSLGLLGLGLFLYILRKMYNFSHVSDSSISFLGYCFFVLFVATNFFESRTYGVNLPFIFLIYFYYLNMTYRRTKYSLPEIVVKGR